MTGDPSMAEEKEKQQQKGQQKDNEQIEKLEQVLDEEKQRSEEYLIRLKYLQADFENLKKRCDRQIEESRKYGNERLIVELLDVVDELELAVKSGRSSEPAEPVLQGVKMTLSKLEKVLKNQGVSPIECVGKPFDPSKHNAVAKVERNDVDECTVIEEVRKGYTMREKVIRPSIVKISVKPSSEPKKEEDEPE
jgi:molecular chaperone GrpE